MNAIYNAATLIESARDRASRFAAQNDIEMAIRTLFADPTAFYDEDVLHRTVGQLTHASHLLGEDRRKAEDLMQAALDALDA